MQEKLKSIEGGTAGEVRSAAALAAETSTSSSSSFNSIARDHSNSSSSSGSGSSGSETDYSSSHTQQLEDGDYSPTTASTYSSDSTFSSLLLHDFELFQSLSTSSSSHPSLLSVREFERALTCVGLQTNDPRLREVFILLAQHAEYSDEMKFEQFRTIVQPAVQLVERALNQKLVVPDWDLFSAELDCIYDSVLPLSSGRPCTTYELQQQEDPETFLLAFCSIDGQQHVRGKNPHRPFTLQSCHKPFTYLLALEELGEETVHRFVGREPSGRNFLDLSLNSEGIPHNPMLDSGALMVLSLIAQEKQSECERYNHLLDYLKRVSGYSQEISFNQAIYLSMRSSCDRTHCLGFMMQERGAFQYGHNRSDPPRPWDQTCSLQTSIDLFLSLCSMELTISAASVIAATLANGGVCPLTGERIFEAENVKNCLSLMLSCGLYEYSGEWAYTIGLPAISGVSGCMMIVIPNVGGLVTYSPPLDSLRNSVRGIETGKRMAKRFELHMFALGRERGEGESEGEEGNAGRGDGREDKKEEGSKNESSAAVGSFYRSVITSSPSLPSSSLSPLPTLRAASSPSSFNTIAPTPSRRSLVPSGTHFKSSFRSTDKVIAANYYAAAGDLGGLKSLFASGVDLSECDYDGRAPLHLAASEGQMEIVKYLLFKGVEINPIDRMKGTPYRDALAHGHKQVADYIRESGGKLESELCEEEEQENNSAADAV